MAQVERIRCFIAIDIGAEIRAALQTLTRELARSGADARWVRPEGMHATLKFLGGVEAVRLPAVREAVERVASKHPAMTMSVAKLGAFPSLRRPRVLWAGLDCPGIAELAEAIDAALCDLGFDAEKRAFNPHITLARIRTPRRLKELETAVIEHGDDDFGSVDVSDVTIYRSKLHPHGAVYETLWTIPLAQHK